MHYRWRVNSGQGILHHTAIYADLETINALLAFQLQSLDTDAQDDSGCTALDLLQNRVPQASSDILRAFERLLKQIEAHNAMSTVWTAVSSDAESTMDWDTASEGSLGEKLDGKLEASCSEVEIGRLELKDRGPKGG